MLKITPSIGIMVLVVSIGEISIPSLVTSCCSSSLYCCLLLHSGADGSAAISAHEGTFVDFWLAPLSRKVEIPSIFKSMWIRVPIFIILMGFMGFRIVGTNGIVDRLGLVFVTIFILTTSIAILFGVLIAPRAGASFARWERCKELQEEENTSSKWTKSCVLNAENARRSAQCNCL